MVGLTRRITLSRGVGKKSDVRSRLDSVSGAAVRCLDTRGVLTSRQGTGTRTPRGRKRQTNSPNHIKIPRFRTGRLAFDGLDVESLAAHPTSSKYIHDSVG